MAQPWHQDAQRPNFVKRVSNLFDRRRERQDTTSSRGTTTFEVPLFLSPTRYQQPQVHDGFEDMYHADTRSQSSTRSLIDAAAPTANHIPPRTIPSSSCYSSPMSSPTLPQASSLPCHHSPQIPSRASSRDCTTSSGSTKRTARHSKRSRRRAFIRRKIQGLRTVSILTGITLLITLVTYLALAVTGAGAGIMFHVLMVLFILSLAGVLAHSVIRMVVLSRSLKESRSGRRDVEHSARDRRHAGNAYFGEMSAHEGNNVDDLPTEKPIRILMAEDEETAPTQRTGVQAVKYPPPVYGNFRTSKRMNPNLVHWQKVPPSPLTPTYDEAMADVRRAVGYRPPSYIESENGTPYVVEHGKAHFEPALRDIHPLERERIAHLGPNVI